MKYLVISDVHGNYPALKSVFDKELRDVDGVIFAGDAIGLMGYPSETIELLKQYSTHAVKGNHDIAVLEWEEGHVNNKELSDFELQLNQNNLTEKQKTWVENLSPIKFIDDENILLAHAYPNISNSSGIELGNSGVDKKDYIKIASKSDTDKYDFIILGHTHDQNMLNCRKFNHDVSILNPGSIGQPINKPAQYAIIDTDTNNIELKEQEYDYNSVLNKLDEENIPIKWWK